MQETNTAFGIQSAKGLSLLADFDAISVCLNPRSPIRPRHCVFLVSQEAWWANYPD